MKLKPNVFYTSPKGREYRVIKIEKVSNSEKWINRVLHFKWMVTIKFREGDTNILTYDYNDKLININ